MAFKNHHKLYQAAKSAIENQLVERARLWNSCVTPEQRAVLLEEIAEEERIARQKEILLIDNRRTRRKMRQRGA